MHTLHIEAATVAFGPLTLSWKRARDSGEFGIKKNWPLIGFALALICSLPPSFISLFEDHKESLALINKELNFWAGISLGFGISVIIFSTIKKVTDVGSALLLLSALGVGFFHITTSKLVQLADGRWTPPEAKSSALPELSELKSRGSKQSAVVKLAGDAAPPNSTHTQGN